MIKKRRDAKLNNRQTQTLVGHHDHTMFNPFQTGETTLFPAAPIIHNP